MLNCPVCNTSNPLNVEECTQCGQDLTLLKVTKNRAFSHFNEGVEFAERKRYKEAKKELLVAVELDSSEPSFFLVLGSVCAHLKEMDLAKKYWQKGLAIDPKYKNIHENLVKYEHYPFLRKIRYYSRVLGIVTIVSFLAFFIVLVLNWQARREVNRFSQQLESVYEAPLPVRVDYEHEEVNRLATRINEGYFALQKEILENLAYHEPESVPEILEKWEYLASRYDYEPPADFKGHLHDVIRFYLQRSFYVHSYEQFKKEFEEMQVEYSELAPGLWQEKEEYFTDKHVSTLISSLERDIPADAAAMADRLSQLQDYREEMPDDRWDKLEGFLLATWWDDQEERLAHKVEAGAFEEARGLLASFEPLEKYFDEPQREEYNQWKNDVQVQYMDTIWDKFVAKYQEQAWEQAYEHGEVLFADFKEKLEEQQLARLEDKFQTIQNRLRWRYWQSLEEKHSVIIREDFSAEEAEDFVRKVDVILYEELPARLYFIKDNVLLYRGLAYLKLDDLEKARQDLQRISEMPESPYHELAGEKLVEIEQEQ